MVGIFMGLLAKTNAKSGFCQAQVTAVQGGNVLNCTGAPVLVPSKFRPGTFFVGCTGFNMDGFKTLKVKRNGMRNMHYASRVSLEGELLSYLRDLLSGKEVPSIQERSPSTFVRGKHKSKDKCPRHGCDLVRLSYKAYPGDKISSHSMSVFEPLGYHEDTPYDRKVLYVSCVGEHLHPAPPPVEAAVMKLRIFDYLCEQKKWSSLAQLRNAVALALQRVEHTENGPIQLFNGTLTIPRAVLQLRLIMLRPSIPKLAVEVGELSMMAAEEENHYVRGMKIVGEKYVFFLGLEELLAFASHRLTYAGDATFKTVTEETRSVGEGRWYLCNIVANANMDRLNGKSVVVMRALSTCLSRDVYCAIWTHFFKSIALCWGKIRGIEDLNTVCIKVAFIPIPRTMDSRCCQVSAITMDFG